MNLVTDLCGSLITCYGPVIGTAFTIIFAALPMFGLLNLLLLPLLLNRRLDPYFIDDPSLPEAEMPFNYVRPTPSYSSRATVYMLAVIYKNGTRSGYLGKNLINARKYVPRWIVGICFACYAWMGVVFGAGLILGAYFFSIHVHDKWLEIQPRWQLQCDIDHKV